MVEKKTGFLERGVDAVARKLKIGGLEKKDGTYVATKDLKPEDRRKVEELAARREAEVSGSFALAMGGDRKGIAETKKRVKELSGEINNIYAGKGKKTPQEEMADFEADINAAMARAAAKVDAVKGKEKKK
jgi:hypothetical protein